MAAVLEKTEVTADVFQIVIADDEPRVRARLKQVLAEAVEGARVNEAGDLASLAALIRRGSAVDLILLDLGMPGVSGFSGLLYLRSQHPHVPMIVVSEAVDPRVVRRCIGAGAAGYIPKHADLATMREAIRLVIAGETSMPVGFDGTPDPDPDAAEIMRRLATLTPQQLRVLMLLAQGLLNKQIAYELTVSEATVKAHVSAILQKLDVDGRVQAVNAVAKLDANLFTPAGRT